MNQQTITLNIEGMSCDGCVKSVTNALNQLTGVQHATVSLEQKNAVISFDNSQTDATDLKQAIEDAGFDVVSS